MKGRTFLNHVLCFLVFGHFISQGNYLIKRQHLFTYISAHCHLHKRLVDFSASLGHHLYAWPSGSPDCKKVQHFDAWSSDNAEWSYYSGNMLYLP